MANDFYTRVKSFASGTKAKGTDVKSELDLIVAGLDLLPSRLQLESANSAYVTAGGTADAITFVHPIETWTTYTGKDGHRFSVEIATVNTTAVTINVDGVGTRALVLQGDTALSGGELLAGGVFDIINNDALGKFILLGTTSAADAAAAAASATAAAASAASIPSILGRQTEYFPASSMSSRLDNGASNGKIETATNKVTILTKDFDTALDQYVQFMVQMPKGWDAGTVAAVFTWSHAATTTNFGVRFFIQATSFTDGDTLETAFGTAVGHTADTGGTTDDVYLTAETGAVTIAGTPAKSEYVIFQIYRDISDAGDTLAIDARLHGISLFYDIDAYSDD